MLLLIEKNKLSRLANLKKLFWLPEKFEEQKMSLRHLASVCRIKKIRPIENADLLVVAEVKGWDVVVKKEEFVEGDLCVYFEIDSMLQQVPNVEFMKERGYRVKTIKLRGQISQGLCMPLSVFPSLIDPSVAKEDDDVTDILRVEKYEPDVGGNGVMRPGANFPSDIVRKTECERVQNLRNDVENGRFANVEFTKTEKIDGCSATFGWTEDGKTWHTCSRNLSLKEGEDQSATSDYWWRVVYRYDLRTKLESSPGLFIQGEILGPGIQGNAYKMPATTFFLFSAFDSVNGEYLSWDELEQLATRLAIPIVPVAERRTCFPEGTTVKALLEDASGKSVLNPKAIREGFVYANANRVRRNDRVIIKCISNEYLLKKKE